MSSRQWADEIEQLLEGVLEGDGVEAFLYGADRVTALEKLNSDLLAASRSRSTINMACGIIIYHNRCSHEEAFKILRVAAVSRNRKLRDVAEEIVNQSQPRRQPPAWPPTQHPR